MITPGAWLGVLGGGQLGRMFTMAAHQLGYRVMVLEPDRDSGAGAVADRHLCAPLDDAAALDDMARTCAAVTVETENAPAASLEFLAGRIPVAPDARSIATAQDRMREKQFIASLGLGTAPFAAIHGVDDLADRRVDPLLPGILKHSRFGYDGKGQARVASADAARDAFVEMGSRPCVLEKMIALRLELSVVLARDRTGAITTWPVAENRHEHGILDVSIVPARIDDALAAQARDAAMRIAERLGYTGVLCVEFFVDTGGTLLVNEIAPRPHNSGHWTIDACATSQFEQQVRVLAGLPLGDTTQRSPVAMQNLLGDLWEGGVPRWEAVLAEPAAKLHLYGKPAARPGRKMGHFTCTAGSAGDALGRALRLRDALVRGTGA